MLINGKVLKADGFSDAEIQQIADHVEAAVGAGRFEDRAALVMLGKSKDNLKFVCLTVAEILDRLRPGCWLDRE